MKTSPFLLRPFVSPKLIATILVSLAAVPAPSRAEKGGSPVASRSRQAMQGTTKRSAAAGVSAAPRREAQAKNTNNRSGLQATPKTWSQSRTTLLPSQGSQRVATAGRGNSLPATISFPTASQTPPTSRTTRGVVNPNLTSPGRLVRDAGKLVDGRVRIPEPLPDGLAVGGSRTPGADILKGVRQEGGLGDRIPGQNRDSLARGTADLAGSARDGAVQQLRDAGKAEWRAQYDYAKGDATSRYSAETEGEQPAGSGAEKAEKSGAWDKVKNWVSSVFGTAVGNPAAKGVVGNGAGAVAGTAFSILTSNNTVEDKTNEANGIIGLFRQGKRDSINESEAAQLKQVEGQHTPTPDSAVATSPFTRKAVERVTAWAPAKVRTASPKEMTGQPAEPGSSLDVADLKAQLEKFEAIQNPNPTQNWAINYGDAVQGSSPVSTPVKAGYLPPEKDPVKPELDAQAPSTPR